jgi:hypothetical protein
MALKPDRNVLEDDISHFYASSLLNTSTDDRGGVVVATGTAGTAPSGAAMDQSVNQCVYVAAPSGHHPLGMLMVDVVNVDLTRQILNPYKSEAQVGDKVVLMRKGYAVTNKLSSTTGTITQGAAAFCGPSGNLTADEGRVWATGYNADGVVTGVDPDTGGFGDFKTEFPRVGTFMSKVDEDGYAKVYIDLPASLNYVQPKA